MYKIVYLFSKSDDVVVSKSKSFSNLRSMTLFVKSKLSDSRYKFETIDTCDVETGYIVYFNGSPILFYI